MAITYHAGRRLQALSTDVNPTYSDDFSSDGWTDNDSTNMGVSGGSFNWNAKRDGTNDASVYDLTSTSANWVLRFKLHVTNVSSSTQAGNGFFVGLSDSNQTAGQSTSQDFIGMSIYNDNTDTYQTIDADGATVPRLWAGDNSQTTTYSTGSIYYYQIIKTGSSYTVEGFTGSDYSTGSTGSISGTSSASGLRYLKILNETDNIVTSTNPFQGTINALKFYDGVTVANSGKPTNVQVGSRFEETDTRKMYHYNSTGDVTTDGSYTILKYKSDGTFKPTSAFNVEYLVVAGGASGGGKGAGGSGEGGGGGGAGEYLTNFGGTALGVTAQSYSVTVGSGGSSQSAQGTVGNNGTNSIFSSITSTGGGGGASSGSLNGIAGGSGGGGSSSGGTNGSGGSSQSGGNNGGAGGSDNASYRAGGGGGGSSTVGGAGQGSPYQGGVGGTGTSNSITGTATLYSGGGGGYSGGTTGGIGGSSIGGDGGDNQGYAGGNGQSNTGSGGGGAGSTSTAVSSGAGGSGIVILRFLTSGNTYTTTLWTEEGT